MGFNFTRPTFASSSAPVQKKDMLRASASLDFASITAGAQGTLTIPVPGAVVGEDVQVGAAGGAPPVGLQLSAYVSAADVVTVRAHNMSGSPIDAAAFTARVIVWKL